MLKVNVGISRKISKDYQSTGFTLNLEGEITADLNSPETVIERIREYYDLADEALQDQITRHEDVEAVAAREAANEATAAPRQRTPRQNGAQGGTVRSNGNSQEEPATNKQIQYMLNVGKRQGMSKLQLENRVAQILGRRQDLYELSKRDAGVVLDTLTQQ